MITILKNNNNESIIGVFSSTIETNNFLANSKKEIVSNTDIEIIETDLEFFPIYILRKTNVKTYSSNFHFSNPKRIECE